MNRQFHFGQVSPVQYFLSAGVALGLLFASVAEDQTGSTVLLYVQWQVQTLSAIFILVSLHRLLDMLPVFSTLSPWPKLIISGLLGSLFFTPWAMLLDRVFEGGTDSAIGWLGLLSEFRGLGIPVMVAWLALNIPWVLGYSLESKPPTTDTTEPAPLKPPAPDSDAAAPFWDLLNESARGKLLYLKAELHYLKVVTDRAESLILYNLKDAIDELAEDRGLQVHRSYWVAYDAINQFRKTGREGRLLLSDGSSVPVSRTRLQITRTALAKKVLPTAE
ncbi:MAG: LytTR family DNA-binding domain-containing protein [Thiolinea sp.]